MADPEAPAEVGDLRRPPERVAATCNERRKPRDRLRLGVEVLELRADVDMDAEHIEPEVERLRDDGTGLVGRQAELRAMMARPDRLVRVCVDAERDADEHLRHACLGGEPGLVRRVQDDRRTSGSGIREERRVLVVAVHDERASSEPRRRRKRELARRGDVGADPFLGQEPEHGDVR